MIKVNRVSALFFEPKSFLSTIILLDISYWRKFMRDIIILACTECKNRNYNTDKNKKNNPDRIEMNKYCKHCKKHTLHKETK